MLPVEPARMRLIGQARVRVSVAEYDFTSLESRANGRGQMLRSSCFIEKELAPRIHGLFQDEFADPFGRGATSRLACEGEGGARERFCGGADERGFARSLRSFKSDE